MLKKLGDRAEFWTVLAIAYGALLVDAGRYFLQHPSGAPIEVSDVELWTTLAYELLAGGLVLLLLRLRGAAWSEFRPRISGLDTWLGSLLFLVAVLLISVAYGLAGALPGGEDRLAPSPVSATFSIPVVVLVAAVNPVFEEWLHLGYVQSRLRPYGAATAVGGALLLRLLIHLPEGPHAVVGVVPMGLLFGAFAWRTGRVWPAVIAHGLLDLISLLAMRAG